MAFCRRAGFAIAMPPDSGNRTGAAQSSALCRAAGAAAGLFERKRKFRLRAAAVLIKGGKANSVSAQGD